ncbi:MAG: (2Fe-2S)-binding protein [Proteobacteria bacterium]|nr:(2Fe-2S)-binding protein [Pseudomonadota bacterium]
MTAISLTVNGQARTLTATPDMPLLWALRQELGLAGPKFGCGAGLCGACTVQIDGQPARACQMPVGAVGTARITTIEGLQRDPLFERLRAAWLEIDVMQCGYCQAGQLLSAHALLKATPQPDAAQIDGAMEGNICRCATYPRIRAAIAKVAKEAGHGR